MTVYIAERRSKFAELTDSSALLDEKYTIWAGKYRRYSGLSRWEKTADIKTLLLNIRDSGYFIIGTIQAWFLLGRVTPDAVFLKGGFVGVPVGLAAAARGVPIVTHDSDVVPGLANRLVSRWASIHAVAMPVESYAYPKAKTKQVGVLVEAAYQKVTASQQNEFRKQIGVPANALMVLVTGGSLGATTINKAIVASVGPLLEEFKDLYIVHQVGKGKLDVYGSYSHDRLTVLEFLRPMHVYMGAANIVVTRGSANTIAEIGVQAKPAIVIPSPYLANGHQMKNAELLQKRGTALVVYENDLMDETAGVRACLARLLGSQKARGELATALHADMRANAAEAVADLLLKTKKIATR